MTIGSDKKIVGLAFSAGRLTWLLCALIVYFTGTLLTGLSTIMANVGMVQQTVALIASGNVSWGEYPLLGKLTVSDANIVSAHRLLRDAVALSENPRGAAWGLGRVNLAMGNYIEALRVLTSVQFTVKSNPFFWSDLIVAASYAGEYNRVIELFEAGLAQPNGSAVLNDAVAFAYLEQFGGNPSNSLSDRSHVEAVLSVRPWDLYSNMTRWVSLSESGNVSAAATVRQALTDFSLVAIHPADERLLKYAAEVIPELYRTGVWDYERLVNVVAFLVWQHPEAEGVETLLNTLAQRYSADARWDLFAGELYQRRGQLHDAIFHYELANGKDPYLALAMLGAGIAREMQGDLIGAAAWYEDYRELVPEDVAGLAALARVSDGLAAVEADELANQLKSLLDDRYSVANKLHVEVDTVALGPNIMPEGDFETSVAGVPVGWAVADYVTRASNTHVAAAFFASTDSLFTIEPHTRSARIDGIWMANPNEGLFGLVSLRDKARGTYTLEIEPHTLYLVSGLYRTSGLHNEVSVYLGNPEIGLFQKTLPPTDHSWQAFRVFGCHSADSSQWMQLLLNSRATGQVWFDKVSVRAVLVDNAIGVCDEIVP